MTIVKGLFTGNIFFTEFWVSEDVLDDLYNRKYPNRNKLVARIERMSKSGFSNWEGTAGNVRHEGDGVYRIGIHSDLFRIYGFYEKNDRRCFIAIKAILKRDKKMSERERNIVKQVKKIKEKKSWEKVYE